MQNKMRGKKKNDGGNVYGLEKRRKGVSLIISVVLISIIVLFSLAVSNLVVASIRQSANVNRANEAFYAAEGALESGLMANQAKGAGYTAASSAVTYCVAGQTCPTGSVKIQGQVPAGSTISEQYIVPTPGTGTVGKDCDPLRAVTEGTFSYTSHLSTGELVSPDLTAPAIDNPCNWNKIKVGETIAVPLYVTTTDSTTNCPLDAVLNQNICNPTNIGLNTLTIKVRTPCENGEIYCSSAGRYSLDSVKGDPVYKGNDTIIGWEISGISLDHKKSYTLKPVTDLLSTKVRTSLNSEIYEGKINSKKSIDYAVVTSGNYGDDINRVRGKIIEFLKNTETTTFARTGNDVINKPVLKLTLIHSLIDTLGSNIPYLEYQIVTDATITNNIHPADSAQTITAEGLSGEFKQVLEVKLPQETGLLEYVIQQ